MENEHDCEALDLYKELWGRNAKPPVRLTADNRSYLLQLLREREAAEERDRYDEQ